LCIIHDTNRPALYPPLWLKPPSLEHEIRSNQSRTSFQGRVISTCVKVCSALSICRCNARRGQLRMTIMQGDLKRSFNTAALSDRRRLRIRTHDGQLHSLLHSSLSCYMADEATWTRLKVRDTMSRTLRCRFGAMLRRNNLCRRADKTGDNMPVLNKAPLEHILDAHEGELADFRNEAVSNCGSPFGLYNDRL
jgi:hypothetical protein